MFDGRTSTKIPNFDKPYSKLCEAPALCVIIITVAGCGIGFPGMWQRTYENNKNFMKSRILRRFATEWLMAILSVTLAYLVTGVVTDVIKNMYGRPRPDFLSRCFTPLEPKFQTANGPNLWLTLPSREHKKATTELQQKALEEYGENATNVGQKPPFPYIEDVKSIIDTKDCINQDYHLLFSGGRR